MASKRLYSVGGRGRGRGGLSINEKETSAKDRASDERLARAAAISAKAKQLAEEQDFDSSSEGDDLNDDEISSVTLKGYTTATEGDLARTKSLLNDLCRSGAIVCLICISSVKRDNPVWNCCGCFTVFHLQCIQKWARDGVALRQLHGTATEEKTEHWFCPKCRKEYVASQCPTQYLCFCGKEIDPKFDPWLVPHSCGQTCGRLLQPECGHSCSILCHPGPCPPCPLTVRVSCCCGRSDSAVRRCSAPYWSCGKRCEKKLQCDRHVCQKPCHGGDCPPCSKTSQRSCRCGNESEIRPCASPDWQCGKVCGKVYPCGHHKCEEVCHAGSCGSCPRSGNRRCPCGKTKSVLPCTEDVPSCGDTCGKLLSCGVHRCMQLCHTGDCGLCRQMVKKACCCGRKEKTVQCHQEYYCETKCDRKRDCGRHPCKRKCCDGNCSPCEQLCQRLLNCRNHKCSSRCHSGQCYPCIETVDIACNCGATVVTVPCGREKRTRPPRCKEPCKIPPDCHHSQRQAHVCHFGNCPPCTQICSKPLVGCEHACPFKCHTAVRKSIQTNRPVGLAPWKSYTAPTQPSLVELPCEPCQIPLTLRCFGGHQTQSFPCSKARPFSCGWPCDRPLACTNHKCELPCHPEENPCEVCERPCSRPRPAGCRHECWSACHPGVCEPCKAIIKFQCHCQVTTLRVKCYEWTSASESKRMEMKCCGNQCPLSLDCGHRCWMTCHEGPCPDARECEKKTAVRCSCRRIKKDFPCREVKTGRVSVPCSLECEEEKLKKEKERAELERKQYEETRLKNQKEVEEFKRKIEGRKRKRKEKVVLEEKKGFWQKRWQIILPCVILVLAIIFAYVYFG
ncbi:NF-X1-type zinc finger protein NFXL1-like [Oscarella lobularis]|uniref:NF-X1-type zinc finger protein NFXL1-like n=1 Tax=Oscarella lobularis TaxID=121494 RepID=UPI003313BCB9